MADSGEDQRALAAACLLSHDRVLDADAAGDVVGASRGTIERWRDAEPPLPHGPGPGQRPAYLFSEYEVVEYALTARPRWRKEALSRIQAKTPDYVADGRADPGPHPDTAATNDWAYPGLPVTYAGPVVRERDRLRADSDRLTEQLERVLDMLNEESKSRRRQVKKFIAAIRAANIPGNTQALDDLLGGR